MSIEISSSSISSLQEPGISAGTSATSYTGTSFQELMGTSTAAAATQELTALQMLFRSPAVASSVPTTASTTANPGVGSAGSSSGTETGSAGSASGTGTGTSDNPLEPLDPSPAATWNTTVIRPYPTPALAGQAKSAVLAALQKVGIDPATVKISYWEELVGYPGGSYTNRNITIQTAGGNKIDLDAAYMARCPWLAASAVKDLDQVVT